MTEVRSVKLDMAPADADASHGADTVVAVTLALTLRDTSGSLRESSVVLTPAKATHLDNLATLLPDLIARVRTKGLAPAIRPGELPVDAVIELDSFDFDTLKFDPYE